MTDFRHAYTALTPDESESDDARSLAASCSMSTRWNEACDSGRRFIERNTGLLFVMTSQAFLSAVNVGVKKLNSLDPPVSTLQLVFVRMSITYICCIVIMLWQKVPNPFLGPKEVRWLLALRGFTGFFGLFGVYFSLNYLSLSDATVLTFLAPLCTGVAGSLFLKETFTKKQVLAGLCSLIGVVLIARPPFLFGDTSSSDLVPPAPVTAEDVGLLPENVEPAEKGTSTERMIAVGVSLIGVLGATGAYTSIRAIGKRAHALHTLASFALLCVVVSVIGMAATRTPVVIPTQPLFLLLLLQIGVFGFVAQCFLTMGLQRETAGRGTMAVYSQIVFATIFERVFFQVVPSALSVIGTLIIIASALYIALAQEKDSKTNDKTQEGVSLEDMGEREMEEGLLEGKGEVEENAGKT